MRRALSRIAILGLLFTVTGIGFAEPPSAEKLKAAEKTFREVYGKDYDKAAKTKNAGERTAFAKKLHDAAVGTKGDPALALVLDDKAYPLAMMDAATLPLAVEIKQARVEDEGRNRAEQLAAVAVVLDKMLKTDRPELRPTTAALLIDCYRDAADAAFEIGAEGTAFLAKAKEIARLLPPAHSSSILKDIATDKDAVDAVRKHAADVKRLTDLLKAVPEEPKANAGMGLTLLRAGRAADAANYFKLATGSENLRKLGEMLAADPPVDPMAIGDLYRTLAGEFGADKSMFLGLARGQYDRSIVAYPLAPETAKLRLLVRDLPAFRSVATRPPLAGSVLELFDERDRCEAVADQMTRGFGTATITLDDTTKFTGAVSLKLKGGSKMNRLADLSATIVNPTPIGSYRYFQFTCKQTGGTRLRIDLYSGNSIFANYIFGAGAAGDLTVPRTTTLPADWLVVTRDLMKDIMFNGPVTGLHIETDGEAWLDAAYFARSLRDLERLRPMAKDAK